MEATARLLLGSLSTAHVLVEPRTYEDADVHDYWDGNWVCTDVRIVVGAFRGNYHAQLRTDEFAHFRQELGWLYETLTGEATFHAMEEWLHLRVVGDGRGHFAVDGAAMDRPGLGNRLAFQLGFDQTHVPAILADLDELLRRFPVRGQR